MIAIVNVDKKPRATGWHDYEIRINKQVLATFRHKREDGLSKCLALASEATSMANLCANLLLEIENDKR